MMMIMICEYFTSDVWFQEISIPSPRRVIDISRGGGVFNTKNFKGKYEAKLEFPEGCGDSSQKTLHGESIVWNNRNASFVSTLSRLT